MLEKLKCLGVGDNDGFFELKKKAKSIMVKVENIETGEIEKSFNCGTNERRAEKLEESLTQRTNLGKYHVYIYIYIYHLTYNHSEKRATKPA